MAILAKVYRNGIRASMPDSSGARSVVIEALPAPDFEGTLGEVAAYLEAQPIGLSVEVRYYQGGKFAGLRSCMNKPALWADLKEKESRYRRYCVDGRVGDWDDAEYQGDGQFAPFVIFDIAAQRNLPGFYETREAANAALWADLKEKESSGAT
jgi:hypothetical protein